jgi:ankyrin repeat protein
MSQDKNPDMLSLENPRVLAHQAVVQLQMQWDSILHPSQSHAPEPYQTPHQKYNKFDFDEVCEYGDGDVSKLKRLILCRKLIFLPVNIHAYTDRALKSASQNGHIEVIKFLLENGADIHADSDKALRYAASYGQLEAVRLLLDRGANIHVYQDESLRVAAENGHTKTVELLLERGAHIHANDDRILRWAARNGHADIVGILLNHGADIHAENDQALQWAADNLRVETMDVLIEHGAPMGKLTKAQHQSYIEYKQTQSEKINDFIISAKPTLTEIFKAATWAGHSREMTQLWQQVPDPLKAEIDFQQVLSGAKIQNIKREKPKVIFVK